MMDPIRARETSERDQLWASLRALGPQIERLAAGEFDGSELQRQLVTVLARIVAAEMSFRAREAGAE
jgi:transposase